MRGKVRFENNSFLFRKAGALSFNPTYLSRVIRTVGKSYSVRFKIKDPRLLSRQITISFDKRPLRRSSILHF
ncbi:FecR domain-containing protein [Pararcticibacter amylolyticus]|uniref:FecR domain-containing protein n=1 Tax=Pararcticibacter amylolyticus TaxID=2173175 RepID=UPI003741F057